MLEMSSYTLTGCPIMKTQLHAMISAKYGHSVEQIIIGL